MKIFARKSLLTEIPGSEDELLLEGSRPMARRHKGTWSLDEEIDARFAWIDGLATDYARLAANTDTISRGTLNFAQINSLSLRYYFVKLLRILAFFRDVRPLDVGESIELHLSSTKDEPYADLFRALGESRGVKLNFHWHEAPASAKRSRPSASWRRWIDRARRRTSRVKHPETSGPRVVLCGNPLILNPVCEQLIACGARVWWLYERFAVRCWWRWRSAGVEQLVCETAPFSARAFNDAAIPSVTHFEGVDLSSAVDRGLAQRMTELGERQSMLIEQVASHFRHVRPTALVLDEDATPLKQIAVASARRQGAVSAVVQHGAPCGRLGFAPLAADWICVWGESSANQLAAWGVPQEKIRMTGWPGIKPRLLTRMPRRHRVDSGDKRFLLLATVPPRDERPDGVEFHLTSENHAAMLGMVIRVLSQTKGAALTVKVHPRTPHGTFSRSQFLGSNFPVRVVRSGDLAGLLSECDCVLSCASTAGIEAALAGAPVIQLLPAGSGDILPADEWGFIGSSRTDEEFVALVAKALERGWRKDADVAARIMVEHGRNAAERIADVVLGRSTMARGEWQIAA